MSGRVGGGGGCLSCIPTPFSMRIMHPTLFSYRYGHASHAKFWQIPLLGSSLTLNSVLFSSEILDPENTFPDPDRYTYVCAAHLKYQDKTFYLVMSLKDLKKINQSTHSMVKENMKAG